MSVRSLNEATIIGNLTADPQLRTTTNGTTVVSFSIATNRSYTDSSGNTQESAEFHNIVAFGKVAEICNQLLQKGSLVFIRGRLQTRKWDSEDGHTNYRTEIVVDDMKLLARGKNSDSFDDSSDSSFEETPKPKKSKEAPSEEVTSEDIPF